MIFILMQASTEEEGRVATLRCRMVDHDQKTNQGAEEKKCKLTMKLLCAVYVLLGIKVIPQMTFDIADLLHPLGLL